MARTKKELLELLATDRHGQTADNHVYKAMIDAIYEQNRTDIQVGFRTIEIPASKFLITGEPIYLNIIQYGEIFNIYFSGQSSSAVTPNLYNQDITLATLSQFPELSEYVGDTIELRLLDDGNSSYLSIDSTGIAVHCRNTSGIAPATIQRALLSSGITTLILTDLLSV